MDETWTVAELADRATQVLAGQPSEASGRVRDLPNERLIRWYTTIGLVDPPLARRGRTALYGRRHLLQLVAVKRRQAEGLPLAGIQAELAGATDGTLATIARLHDAEAASAPAKARLLAHPAGPAPSRERFWASRPLAAAPIAAAAPSPPPGPVPLAGLRLAPGVTLVLDTGTPSTPLAPTPAQLAEVEAAARPLLEALRRHGLAPDPQPAPRRTT
jgi:DNA-binding transcriptional MerR regulator